MFADVRRANTCSFCKVRGLCGGAVFEVMSWSTINTLQSYCPPVVFLFFYFFMLLQYWVFFIGQALNHHVSVFYVVSVVIFLKLFAFLSNFSFHNFLYFCYNFLSIYVSLCFSTFLHIFFLFLYLFNKSFLIYYLFNKTNLLPSITFDQQLT